ncbi:hypothetical protein EJ05DRAFT_490282 [Pseudovirgaria hyperparasitica]|uniref:Uncharacterized protein n=1 Tax=Pseudovirgaria hyperparasitica TaxID=470096 RepID=A0A6A6VVD4_9PEZI|nr:uncharacterized protein EJ05DRAFT_490282 [Pseudovirgaria hyperparasitica]KAF2753227.1 hypothetical protein EJ05DRAFT_490282 [Pseudovirgaria hyperparasitica]
MPGRLDAASGALGKRKRTDDPSDKHAAAILKAKSSSLSLSDHMALDTTALPPSLFALSPQTSAAQNTSQSQAHQPPPRSRRKLIHRISPISIHPAPSAPLHVLSKVLQTPCHRCHKAPLQKTDLSSYTDCARCTERTCVVCIRQCACGRKICADCSVEEGVDGDVYCLDCFGAIQDVDITGSEEACGGTTFEDSGRMADVDREMEEG